MSLLLLHRPATTTAMLAVYDDVAVIADALAFEAALARAEAAEGVIDSAAADAIIAACATMMPDPAPLADEVALAGTFAIPLVGHLRAVLPSDIAPLVHKGATSQDVADTVMMMRACAAQKLLAADAERLCTALYELADRHAVTPAIGRTLLQDALPVGFGLRLAQAAAGIDNAARRLAHEVASNAGIQLGGAAGTRAGLGGRGKAVAGRMADELGLAVGLPWHARRIGVAAIASALGMLIGALGKFARDVSLLAQNSVGEAREPAIAGRGGSSAMAHKRNPTACQVALSAAIRAPGLVAAILGGMPQEEERGLGGWQAEAPVLAELFLLCAGSAEAMRVVAEGLEIDEAAIARNLSASGLGADIGESAAIVADIIAHHKQG
jgi:3-carboxy-cis,cis-muconate cycloisomerase